MYPVPRTKGQHFAGSHLDPAPDRRRFAADSPRDEDRICRHRDDRDPRYFLFCPCQPQAVERDLGQPRPELPGAGNEQGGDAVGAQGALEILRLPEYRRAATGSFLSTWPPASLSQNAVYGFHLRRRRRVAAIQFRQKQRRLNFRPRALDRHPSPLPRARRRRPTSAAGRRSRRRTSSGSRRRRRRGRRRRARS